MKSPTILAVLAAAVLSPACVITPEPVRSSTTPASSTPVATVAEIAAEPILYARDGTPVRQSGVPGQSPGQASLAGVEEPAHGVRRGEQSRMYLLELYQEAIDQKEAFELEARAATVDLELARKEVTAMRTELEEARARIATLEAEHERQSEELRALAQRLITAQIRRLESDKLLLEAKIDWARTRQVIESNAREDGTLTGGSR